MPDTAPQRQAVLLLAHGTPQSLDEIPAYLRNVTSGRPMPESVVEEIRHRYSLIGSSPLTELTQEQGRLLSQALGLPVYVGMRNWKPYIADVVRQMRADGITSAVAICLAPQNSRTSVGLYRRAAFAEAGRHRDGLHRRLGRPPTPRSGLRRTAAASLAKLSRAHRRGRPVLFTAHSVPCRTIQSQPADAQAHTGPRSRPVPVEAKRTAANVAALPRAARPHRRRLVFRLSEPGHVRRNLDRSHRRGHPHRSAPGRPLRRRDPAHRLPLRPRRDPLRHRHRLS